MFYAKFGWTLPNGFRQFIFTISSISPLGKRRDPYFECFVPRLVEIVPRVKDFSNFLNAFSLFRNYLRVKKDRELHFNNLEFLIFKDVLYQVWLKLAQLIWRKICLNFVNIFSLFQYYLCFEKGGVLHLIKTGVCA